MSINFEMPHADVICYSAMSTLVDKMFEHTELAHKMLHSLAKGETVMPEAYEQLMHSFEKVRMAKAHQDETHQWAMDQRTKTK